ncbi:MAG: mechanosensitive ion channel [Chroococcidiopsidaceae cyanobacterium CP_BM_ER_R8_30]|nr:mechanosensitive ion channel [Chroococcidiopsidaceae cyanobacterium CP_BM_ER_R8_30]
MNVFLQKTQGFAGGSSGDFLEQAQFSFSHLISHSIETLPTSIVVLSISYFTLKVANVIREMATVAVKWMTKNQFLQLLLVQMSYVAVWMGGILLASVIAFPSGHFLDVFRLLGLSSIAFAFISRNIFKNILAGVLLLMNKSFDVGEQVIVDSFEGKIEKISILSTQIQTDRGERVIIPNAIVFTSLLHTTTAMSYRRTDLALGVGYNTYLCNAIQILHTTITTVEGVLADPAPEIDVVSFGECLINLRISFWTLAQPAQTRRIQTRAIIALKQVCLKTNILISYQIRILHARNQQQEHKYFSNLKNEGFTENREIDEENYLG